MDLSGKTAVVTGGSRGIGREICIELAKRGANVVLCARSAEGAAQETAALCEAARAESPAPAEGEPQNGQDPRTIVVACNVADAGDVKTLMETARRTFGRIDILVNNAGITKDGLLMRMKEEDFDAVINTNLKGAFLCMKEVSGVMMRQRYGRIVNISSVVGIHGNAGQMNYAASKAGVIGMTKSMARELGSRGITVNAVAPGFIDTDMTAALAPDTREKMAEQIPLKRIGTPQDVAKAVAFLASDEAAYITGQVLSVDGGMYT
ncbi:MAG: 3-oxoacyl-[acyl-carrier-protein] reductase [Lachnospiraceae bacterium]|nr:3-oxoacyl-[acyl-carrier-protein] reductase [Lachnospiraceae bacterium]